MSAASNADFSAVNVRLTWHGVPRMRRMLASLQADFPGYKIWQEDFPDGVRFIARSQRAGLHPHTVMTADPAELRRTLEPQDDSGMAASLAW
jgi:hypothetical protein